MYKIPDHLSRKIAEYKAKVDHGELEWELEPINGDEPLIDSVIPDKLVDIPSPDNKHVGYTSHLPSAKVSRQYSNTVRSFYDD